MLTNKSIYPEFQTLLFGTAGFSAYSSHWTSHSPTCLLKPDCTIHATFLFNLSPHSSIFLPQFACDWALSRNLTKINSKQEKSCKLYIVSFWLAFEGQYWFPLTLFGGEKDMEETFVPFEGIKNDLRGRLMCYKQDWSGGIKAGLRYVMYIYASWNCLAISGVCMYWKVLMFLGFNQWCLIKQTYI